MNDQTLINTICIKLLNHCNLRCSHCWAKSNDQPLVLDTKAILAFLRLLKPLGLSRVSLSGGEPTLYPSMSELLEGCLELGLSLTITTNGVSLNAIEKTLFYLDLYKSNSISIRVSIDGASSHHELLRGANTYAEALNYIGMINRRVDNLGVNTVVSVDTLDSIDQLCMDLIRLKVNHWALMTLAPRGKYRNKSINREDVLVTMIKIVNIAKQLGYSGVIDKWDYLSANNNYLLVEANGTLILPGIKEVDDIVVGDINTVSRNKIINEVNNIRQLQETVFF